MYILIQKTCAARGLQKVLLYVHAAPILDRVAYFFTFLTLLR